MSDTCNAEEDLCPVTKGDTVEFEFTFKRPDGTPINIAYLYFHFVVSQDPDFKEHSVYQDMQFANNSETQTGEGSMKILPVTTNALERGQCYFFKFVLTKGPEDVFTVGSGKWLVK